MKYSEGSGEIILTVQTISDQKHYVPGFSQLYGVVGVDVDLTEF